MGRNVARLHFLHATTWNGESGALVGRYTIHYANGKTETIPLVDGQNINDWWIRPGKEHAHLTTAWRGSNAVAHAGGFQTALFHLTWTNPAPTVAIQSLDLESAADRRVPFIVAITAEAPQTQPK